MSSADAEPVQGTLYRLVPNWQGYWDYENHKPYSRAFRRDEHGEVSMLLASRITLGKIQEVQPGFGVVTFEAEELLNPPPLPPQAFRPKKKPPERNVSIEPRPDPMWGDAHFVVLGITKSLEEWLYQLGKEPGRLVQEPGPVAPYPVDPADAAPPAE